MKILSLPKKPLFWISLISVLACITILILLLQKNNDTPTPVAHPYFSGIVVSAQCDNVTYDFLESSTLEGDTQFIKAEWTNNTEDTLCFGKKFTLYKEGELYQPPIPIGFSLTLRMVKPKEDCTETYELTSYNLTKGKYRLEKEFYLKSNPDKKYTAFIEFSVEEDFSPINGTIQFYKSSTEEHKSPKITSESLIQQDVLSPLLERLRKQNWTYDAIVDRLEFYYDGRLFYGDWIYFGFEQKVIYFKEYFTDLSDSDAKLLKAYMNTSADLSKQIEQGIISLKMTFEKTQPETGYFEAGFSRLSISNEDLIEIYTFETTERAKECKKNISHDGSGITISDKNGKNEHRLYEFIAPPHWYGKDNLVVLYVGQNSKITNLLKGILGKQFAGQ